MARYSGALGGAAKGAATGATIGSVVPGVGTAIGAGVGGIIGGIGGFFAGRNSEKEAEAAAIQEAIARRNRARPIHGNTATMTRYSSFDPNNPEMGGTAPAGVNRFTFRVNPNLTGPARQAAIDAQRTRFMAQQAARDRAQQQKDLIQGANRRITDAGQTFQNYIDPRLQQLDDARVREAAAANQGLMRSGLRGSTLQMAANRGVNADYQRRTNEVTMQNMMNQLQFMDRLKGERQNTIGGFQVGGPDWQTPLNLGQQSAVADYSMQQDAINNQLMRDQIAADKQNSLLSAGAQLGAAYLTKNPALAANRSNLWSNLQAIPPRMRPTGSSTYIPGDYGNYSNVV